MVILGVPSTLRNIATELIIHLLFLPQDSSYKTSIVRATNLVNTALCTNLYNTNTRMKTNDANKENYIEGHPFVISVIRD